MSSEEVLPARAIAESSIRQAQGWVRQEEVQLTAGAREVEVHKTAVLGARPLQY